jgi:SPP1 family predicted phage head-tail adaptor
MNPPDLNKRITLQAPTRVSDPAGGEIVTWADMATVWAKKTTHRSDEAVQAMATSGYAVHNFRIRYRTGIRSDWRIKEGEMNLIGPPIERVESGLRYLDLTVKETF